LAPDRPLRRGWTTGACATAAAKAAATALAGSPFPDPVSISLPRGGTASFALAYARLGEETAVAAVVKDAGDDPDVTHGCTVEAHLRLLPTGQGLVFRAGPGVGTITRPGLQLPPGEPAINPVPRAMIRTAVTGVLGEAADVEVTIAIPGGEKLAERTLNARLGILGGLSILGTTGIVIPYSCSSWIHAIHRGIDVARAAELRHLGAATGSTSERTLRELYGLPDAALIDMGDFVGGTLKYLRAHPVPQLTLAGGFAKLAKLSQGHLDLHSARSILDRAKLAQRVAAAGASSALAAAIADANTAAVMLDAAATNGFPLGDLIAADARAVAAGILGNDIALDVITVDRKGDVVGRAVAAAPTAESQIIPSL
jgi:cobalt-precorrin-5B (C1)-methyltransferase